MLIPLGYFFQTKDLTDRWLVLLLAIVLTFSLASLTYYFIERPFLRLRALWFPKTKVLPSTPHLSPTLIQALAYDQLHFSQQSFFCRVILHLLNDIATSCSVLLSLVLQNSRRKEARFSFSANHLQIPSLASISAAISFNSSYAAS